MAAKTKAKPLGFPELLRAWFWNERADASELARRLDVTPAVVSLWLHGSHAPSRNSWAAIAKTLGCTIEDVAIAIAQGVK